MRLKNTAFVLNVTVNGSSNCDWGTDIGQGVKHTFTLEGFPDVLNAMVYYKIEDTDNLKVVLGRGKRTPRSFSEYPDDQLVLASCFNKVYINGRKLNGQRFIMYILKEVNKYSSNGKINVHYGRCTLKFSNSLLYNDIPVNQNCIDAITSAFGLPKNGSWAILEMEIRNEDELHFKGFSLGESAKDYNSTEERNTEFSELYGEIQPLEEKHISVNEESAILDAQEYMYISAIRTKPFVILGGFSGTGKSQKVRELAFATCPCDGVLDLSETTPGNYQLISVKPNWHDATEITGFRSSVNRSYYVTDFMRFIVKARKYRDKNIPFFVCLDEMNLAPVEEYFADFLSVIESRTRRSDGIIVTDALVPSSVFNDNSYSNDFNIFLSLGLEPINQEWKASDLNTLGKEELPSAFVEEDIVKELLNDGLTIPQNLVIIGTINMDDTTNTFSRKVIDRAMTFETTINEFDFDYFDSDVALNYTLQPKDGRLFISDEVRALQAMQEERYELLDTEREKIIGFINNINKDLDGSPFKISYRILNETILLYRSKLIIQKIVDELGGFEEDIKFSTELNEVFDEILMQKVLPRIEGDYDKCNKCLTKLSIRAEENGWKRSIDKIEFMIEKFGRDKSGFTSFWN